MRKLRDLLPLEFRILYRQFFLRVIDLEALSVHADIPRFLGQFASVLVFTSLIGALGLLFSVDRLAANEYLEFAWRGEQNLISGTMLLVGLVAIVGWDSTFPDRRDVMVLSPLPIAPSTILFAKIAASTSLLGLAVVTLNFASGIAWPLFIGAHHQSGSFLYKHDLILLKMLVGRDGVSGADVLCANDHQMLRAVGFGSDLQDESADVTLSRFGSPQTRLAFIFLQQKWGCASLRSCAWFLLRRYGDQRQQQESREERLISHASNLR